MAGRTPINAGRPGLASACRTATRRTHRYRSSALGHNSRPEALEGARAGRYPHSAASQDGPARGRLLAGGRATPSAVRQPERPLASPHHQSAGRARSRSGGRCWAGREVRHMQTRLHSARSTCRRARYDEDARPGAHSGGLGHSRTPPRRSGGAASWVGRPGDPAANLAFRRGATGAKSRSRSSVIGRD